jgi:hypothetical protein
MQFNGVVSSRSSLKPQRSGVSPPGESEILRLNPQRREAILATTGWHDLFPGTLNLEVDIGVVDGLLTIEPALRESGANVTYPPPFSQIPAKRKGYLYYRALVSFSGRAQPGLIRRAIIPLPRRIEVFSEYRLRDTLLVNDGDVVVCKILAGTY